MNLLSNALKYTMQGKISVKLSNEYFIDEPSKKRIKIEVQDSGIGIRDANFEGMFHLFGNIRFLNGIN